MQQTTHNQNTQVIQLANEELKQKVSIKTKVRPAKKSKKREYSPKNVLFLMILIIALISAFIVRTQRVRYEKDHPEKSYIETTIVFPSDQINEYIKEWNTKINELLPDTLPDF